MINIRFYIFIAGLFFSKVLHSQGVFSGTVKNNEKQPLDGVNITIYSKGNFKIIAHSVSNSKGGFTFKLNENTDSAILEFSHIGYTSLTQNIALGTERILVELSNAEFVLPQVVFENKAIPILKKGDTLNFNIKSFTAKSDNVIGDVIRRLPGIIVASNGQIYYNGKPISNYYIENLDLLGGRYNIANQNIPVTMVDGVQIFENHQSIKILDSSFIPETAALNIQLNSKAKNRIINSSKIVTGISPFLWNIETAAFNFRKKVQIIAGAKANNSGQDLEQELNTLYPGTIQIISQSTVQSHLLSLNNITPPPFEKNKYYFNNSYIGDVNLLKVLNSASQLRTNISWLSNQDKIFAFSQNTYYLAGNTNIIKEDNFQNLKNTKITAEISYTSNTKKEYSKENFIAEIWYNYNEGFIKNMLPITQQLRINTFNIKNDFQRIYSSGRNIIEFSSNTQLLNKPEILKISPGSIYSFTTPPFKAQSIQQNALQTLLSSDNFFSFQRKIIGVYTKIKTGIFYSNEKIESELIPFGSNIQPLPADSFNNNLHWVQIKPYATFSSSFKIKSYYVEFASTFQNIIFSKRSDMVKKKIENYLFYSGSLSVRKEVGSFFIISASFDAGNKLGQINANTTGFIMTNYRNIVSNNTDVQLNRTYNTNILLVYRNAVHQLFGQVSFVHSVEKKNLLDDIYFINQLFSFKTRSFNNENIYSIVNSGLKKYFRNIKTGISLDADFSLSISPQLQNEKLAIINSKSISTNFNINTRHFSWLFPEYTIGFISSRFTIQSNLPFATTKPITQLRQTLNLNFFVNRIITLKNNISFYSSYNDAVGHKYIFIDCGIDIKKGKQRIELNALNITNIENFNSFSSLQNVQVYTSYRLRPFNLLLSYKFSF